MQMDILQATLAAGIRVVKYVPSYGDQPNDITNVTKCTYPSDSPPPRFGRLTYLCAFVDFRDEFRGYHVSVPVSIGSGRRWVSAAC